MPAPTIPVEIYHQIIKRAAESYSTPSGLTATRIQNIETVAAVAATCRLFARLARPLLYKQVFIWNVDRGEELLGMIEDNRVICRWITDVRIQTPWMDDGEFNPLIEWIGGSDEFQLVSLLKTAVSLTLECIRDTGSDELEPVWDSLAHFKFITHLVMNNSDFRSIPAALQLFTEVYQQLQYLCLSSIEFFDDSKGNLEPIVLPHLRHLEHRVTESRAICHVLELFRCPRLTRLDIWPACFWNPSEPKPPYSYATGLIASAPLLEVLSVMNCVEMPGPLDLRHNPHLRQLSFHLVTDPGHQSWVARTVASLPDPVVLELLEISGDLNGIERHFWTSLDNVLSELRFMSTLDERRLVIVQTAPALPSRQQIHPVPLLPKSETLGWFEIEYDIGI